MTYTIYIIILKAFAHIEPTSYPMTLSLVPEMLITGIVQVSHGAATIFYTTLTQV